MTRNPIITRPRSKPAVLRLAGLMDEALAMDPVTLTADPTTERAAELLPGSVLDGQGRINLLLLADHLRDLTFTGDSDDPGGFIADSTFWRCAAVIAHHVQPGTKRMSRRQAYLAAGRGQEWDARWGPSTYATHAPTEPVEPVESQALRFTERMSRRQAYLAADEYGRVSTGQVRRAAAMNTVGAGLDLPIGIIMEGYRHWLPSMSDAEFAIFDAGMQALLVRERTIRAAVNR